ncbi:MAG: DNA processing protein [Paracoccaceae bacterium]
MTDSLFGPNFASAIPPSDVDAITWLQLIRSRRVGPSTFHRLMGEYGNAAASLAALPEIAHAAGVKSYTVYPRVEAEREFVAGQTVGAELILFGTPEYPPLLAKITDAPPILWIKGTLEPRSETIALVGARNASSLGTRMAKLLAGELGRAGYSVASGLARGIDTAAHLGSLATGTIAVMAGGVDFIYPRENQKLAEEIAESGLLLSEQPIGLSPQARHFPRRNRLISGLSRAVIVVEGAAKSGSLITARDALDQGREVMAVPGHPLDARASGCNMLIRDGAILVRSANDVIEALALPESGEITETISAEPPKATIPEALDLSRKILSLLSPSPIPEDQLIRELNLPPQTVSSHLVSLELDGKLARQAGGMLSLAV